MKATGGRSVPLSCALSTGCDSTIVNNNIIYVSKDVIEKRGRFTPLGPFRCFTSMPPTRSRRAESDAINYIYNGKAIALTAP